MHHEKFVVALVHVTQVVKHIPQHLLTAATVWTDFGLHLPAWGLFCERGQWEWSQGGGRGMKCLFFLCQVNFLKHWTAGLNISKQQIVWDQSAALGFITQISSVTVPKQKVWLAWEEHPYEIWALLWNESGCMGENREYRVQNLSCCAFHMMKFPLLKRPEPKQKEGAEGTENFCGRTVLHVLFYVMKWIQLYPADCN